MSNIIHLPSRTRTLSRIMDEIEEAWRTFEDSWNLSVQERSDALDNLDRLQREARTMIEAATGIEWTRLEKVAL